MAGWMVADGGSHQSGGVVEVGSLTKETRKEGKARETWQQPEPLQRTPTAIKATTTRLKIWVATSNYNPQTGAVR